MLKRFDIEITKEDPYLNDKLERKSVGETLKSIIDIYGSQGCVLAINGEWGTGKTTFIKMWEKDLLNSGYEVLFYNAWETDYIADPVITIVHKLLELVSEDSKEYKGLKSLLGKLVVDVTKDFGSNVLRNISKFAPNTVDELENIASAYISNIFEQKHNIDALKKELKSFINEHAEKHPIVFFIDELDRCNPHYAVSVLETIKHLFEESNVVFVLAINRTALCAAIKGYYGSDSIDAEEYLRRFIDFEYHLPKPNIETYCNFLYDHYGYNSFLENKERKQYQEFIYDDMVFKKFAYSFCQSLNLNLRFIDRLYSYTRLTMYQFSLNSIVYPRLYFILCFIRTKDSEFFYKIKDASLSIQSLLQYFENNFPKKMLNPPQPDHSLIIYEVAMLLVYYYDLQKHSEFLNARYGYGENKINNLDDLKNFFNVKPVVFDEEDFWEQISNHFSKFDEYFRLSTLLDNIDLLAGFQKS